MTLSNSCTKSIPFHHTNSVSPPFSSFFSLQSAHKPIRHVPVSPFDHTISSLSILPNTHPFRSLSITNRLSLPSPHYFQQTPILTESPFHKQTHPQIARTMTSPPSTPSPDFTNRPSFSYWASAISPNMPKSPVNVLPHPRHRHVSHSFNASLLNAKHITLSLNLPTRSHASIS